MPHAEDDLKIDGNGNLSYTYPTSYPTSPADTLASEFLGMPAKGASPWTDQAAASSSAAKPSQSQLRHRSQKPKQSFLDTGVDDNEFDHRKDDSVQLVPNAASLLPAPFAGFEKPNEASRVKRLAQNGSNSDENYPVPPRSGQNVYLSVTDDGEEQGSMSDADKSPTPKPSRLTSSRQRRMSDASDIPAPSQPERMLSSRQKEMSDPATIEERPRNKGILRFSSAAPSVTDSVDQEPLRKTLHNVREKSSVPSQMTDLAKKMTRQRKSAINSNTKVRLSALDFEDGEQSGDPFDQANIPPSRGISPGPSRQKSKRASQKQSIEKPKKASPPTTGSVPRDKKAITKLSKSSPKDRPSAKPRQKARASAAGVVQQSFAPDCGEDNEDDGYLPKEPVRPKSDGFRAKPPRAEALAAALSRAVKTVKGNDSISQKAISSATDYEDSDTDESDGDEYVDGSKSKGMQGNRQLPETRNVATRSRGRNGVSAESNKSNSIGRITKATQKQLEPDGGHELTSKASSKTSTKYVAQASVLNPEPAVETQPKKATVTLAPSPLTKTSATQEFESVPKQHRSPGETGEALSAIAPGTRQVDRAETAIADKVKPRNANGGRKEPIMAVDNPKEFHGHQIRVTRQSPADKPQSVPTTFKADQNRKQSKHTQIAMEPSPHQTHFERQRDTIVAKKKDRKANSIAFGADGPKNAGKVKQKDTVAEYHPKLQNSCNRTGTNTSKAVRADKSPTGSKHAVEKRDQSSTGSAGSSFQAKNLPSAISSAVDLPSSPEKPHVQGSRVLQNTSTTIARQPSAILEEDEHDLTSPPARVTVGKHTVSTQLIPEQNDVNYEDFANADDADKVTDIRIGDKIIDKIEGLLKTDSLQKSNIIENSPPVLQTRDSTMDSNLLGQDSIGRANVRKRPHVVECASQSVLPNKYRLNTQSQFDNQAPQCSSQSDQKMEIDREIHQITLHRKAMTESESSSEQSVLQGQTKAQQHHTFSHQSAMAKQPCVVAEQEPVNGHLNTNQQPLLGHQPAKSQKVAMEQLRFLTKQPAWKQQFTMSQQPTRSKDPFKIEQGGNYVLTRDLQAPLRQETARHQLPTLQNFSQPGTGKDSAMTYLQDLSTNLQRPSKRMKLGLPPPGVEPAMSAHYHQSCVPANGFGSDDVFAPNNFSQKTNVDHDVVNQLRGVRPSKFPTAPEPATQRPTSDHSEERSETTRPYLGTRNLKNAAYSHSMQKDSQGHSRVESSDDTGGFGLRRRTMPNRRHREPPGVKHRELVAIEDPVPDEGIEDAMHRVVAVSCFVSESVAICLTPSQGVLRALHSKESEVSQVVDDYRFRGSRIIESIAATHDKEREQLIDEHTKKRLEYIRICENARRQIHLISTSLQAIDFGKIPMRNIKTKTLHRPKKL